MDNTTPQLTFPAEWEPQEAIWFAWPTRDDLWSGHQGAIRDTLASLYALAARYQTVRVLCPRALWADLRDRIAAAGGDTGQIELFDYQTDDVWCRDFGPIFLRRADGRIVASSWEYNAWGGKFSQFQRDNAAPEWIAEQLGLDCFEYPLILEGGAVESNGSGSLLTTEVVLLNPNRQSGKDAQAIERLLCRAFGLEQVLWLAGGLEGDDTDGHIDNLGRFFAADGIVHAVCAEEDTANFASLSENTRRLRSFRQPNGDPFRLVELPIPDPIFSDGQRLAASYLNFLVLNDAVLLPSYAEPEKDAQAKAILAECFPGRTIELFDCRTILLEGGAIHCLSQPQPS